MSEQEKSSTYLVTHAEDSSAMLTDVHGGQVHTLSDNPGVEAGEVVEATVSPDPPMEVTYSVVEVAERYTVEVFASEEAPTQQARELAEGLPEGDLATAERAGDGEIHVLAVPESDTEDAVADVVDDQATVERAARVGARRVEVRSEPGLINVRYLP
ncbi:hypothetical protein J2752_000949 [Halarchaeum rubridurum]|uniref:Uncharacterized protein n=1 Tax=Halarchaeum rubridurum TaxID=489911 RepID=A0A830FP86_9EURY|nr:DUF5812 family protein [Halarchaeum rubridurum]MBP1954068.1 hypothetical protein [Halarchaeum rubridurum]GGM57067.1 hypothetical protein GCM10009017_04070 [Halarchaeum rubridurum]